MSVVKNPSKVYIGNIPRDAEEGEIQKMFAEAGKLLSLEFKGDFAFCEYSDASVAEEAIRYLYIIIFHYIFLDHINYFFIHL